jgi:IS4 transposase
MEQKNNDSYFGQNKFVAAGGQGIVQGVAGKFGMQWLLTAIEAVTKKPMPTLRKYLVPTAALVSAVDGAVRGYNHGVDAKNQFDDLCADRSMLQERLDLSEQRARVAEDHVNKLMKRRSEPSSPVVTR